MWLKEMPTFDHLLGHWHRVDEARIEAIAQVADSLGDGVELHLLRVSDNL